MKRKEKGTISVILVSGIPGSGKGKLAQTLNGKLGNEYLESVSFKMQTVQSSIKYTTPSFIDALSKFTASHEATLAKDGKTLDVVVATLPSYHHLKKAIFELRKSEEFTARFEIKFVLTKVHARNFYINKNRNVYQFLIENCMKGVTQAIIFEKANIAQGEFQIMQKVLENANWRDCVLPMSGKAFDLETLSQILIRQNDKFNMLYTKHFYGFEKEGKSAYYIEKQAQGHYFNYKYPVKESMIKDTILKVLSEAVDEDSIKRIKPKSNVELEKEQQVKENEQKRIDAMTGVEKRKWEIQQRRKARQEEDDLSEKLLLEQISQTKRKVATTLAQQSVDDVVFERIRGIV